MRILAVRARVSGRRAGHRRANCSKTSDRRRSKLTQNRAAKCECRSGPASCCTYDVSYSTYVTAGTVTMNVQSKRPSLQLGRLLRRGRSAADAAHVEAVYAVLQG